MQLQAAQHRAEAHRPLIAQSEAVLGAMRGAARDAANAVLLTYSMPRRHASRQIGKQTEGHLCIQIQTCMPPIYTPPSSNRLFNLYPPFPLSPSTSPADQTQQTQGVQTHTRGVQGVQGVQAPARYSDPRRLQRVPWDLLFVRDPLERLRLHYRGAMAVLLRRVVKLTPRQG
jgi:hypothetical protein